MEKTSERNSISQLQAYVFLFAKRICSTIEEMTGIQFCIDETSYCESPLHFQNTMIIYIPFYGAVQGEFLVAVDEQSALVLAGISEIATSQDDLMKNREYSSSFFDEVLNIGVAQTIIELERMYENLTYSPAISVFGEILFPMVKSAVIGITSGNYHIKCGFSLNLVRPKIADTLQDVQRSLKHTVKLANTDSLTGLYNRVFFDLNFQKYVAESQAKQKKLCFIIIDVDHFKGFNDTYGHLIGDRVLSGIAEVIQSKIRGGDFAVRYGGDEMAIILDDTELNGALLVCERISASVKATRSVYKLDDKEIKLEVTLSIGITQLRDDDSPQSFFERADTNLYKAKEDGRDRVVATV